MLLTQQRSDGFSAYCEIPICVKIDLVYSLCRNYSRWSRSPQQRHRREPLSPSGSRSSEWSPRLRFYHREGNLMVARSTPGNGDLVVREETRDGRSEEHTSEIQ